MKIVFDFDFDDGAWPGPLRESGRTSLLDVQWLGPLGLLGRLETFLGLGGEFASFSERALSLVGELSGKPGFWSSSLRAEAFTTAQKVLQLRDDLWLAGWRGKARTVRLTQLARVTRDVAPGLPDRLAAVLENLPGRAVPIERIELTDDLDALPWSWRGVFGLLASAGVEIVKKKIAPVAAVGDLAASRVKGFVPEGDGSLRLLRSCGPLQAAEEVAAHLASLDSPDGVLIIWPDPLLDMALHRHGLPTSGAGSELHKKATHSVLPLVVGLGWSPVDPRLVMELLTLPRSPVGPDVARRLLEALCEWPAVGSPDWRRNLQAGLNAIRDSQRRENTSKRLSELFNPVAKTGDRYPLAELTKRVRLVANWLHGIESTHADEEKFWSKVGEQCSTVEKLARSSGLSDFSAAELRLVIEQATQASAHNSPFSAQAGLATVGEPGCVAGPAKRIVWWNFSLSKFSPPVALPLSVEELAELEAGGVSLPDPGSKALGASNRWKRPFDMAANSLLLVCPQYSEDGREEFPHPAWVKARLADYKLDSRLVVGAMDERSMPARKKFDSLPLPRAAKILAAPPDRISPRGQESPSSLGELLGCPFKWVLGKKGRLHAGWSAALPNADDSALRGRLAHLILAELFTLRKDGEKPSPAEAEQRAQLLFEERAPELFAALFLPGRDAARAEMRRIVGQAARRLFELLDRTALDVMAVEENFTAPFLDIELRGRPDLVIGKSEAIIDLKWSGAIFRRRQMQQGSAYQLAAYGRLIRGERGDFPSVAYYILKDDLLLAEDKKVFPDAETPRDAVASEIVWQALEQTCRDRFEALSQGSLIVGQPAAGSGSDPGSLQNGRLNISAPCRFCDFGSLCGLGLGRGQCEEEQIG